MSKHFERDLDQLRRAVLTMAAAVEEAIHTATRALRERDAAMAKACVLADAAIDGMENALQEECLKVMALHQPVASDLRHVCAVLLITTDLERMGDLAVGVAKRAKRLARQPHVEVPPRLWEMAARVTHMVRQSFDAFVNSDPRLARAVIPLDTQVDDDNDALIAAVTGLMKGSADAIDAGMSLFSVVRHFERIADHATNVAEDVVYLVEGEQMRHGRRSS